MRKTKETKEEAILRENLAIRERNGGNAYCAGLPLRLIQMMENIGLPEKWVNIDMISRNFPNFQYAVDQCKTRGRNKVRVKELAREVALNHRSLVGIRGDIDEQPVLLPSFRLRK